MQTFSFSFAKFISIIKIWPCIQTWKKSELLYKPQIKLLNCLSFRRALAGASYGSICSAWKMMPAVFSRNWRCGTLQIWESSFRTDYYRMPFTGGNGTLLDFRDHLSGCSQGGLCCLAVGIFFLDIYKLTTFSTALAFLFMSWSVT